MKNPTSKLSVLVLSLIMALTACAPSSRRTLNDGQANQTGIIDTEEEQAPEFEQEEVSFDDSFKKSIEEKGAKAEEYEAPEAIKNGDDIMYVGYTKLKNVKSTFDRNTRILEVSGIAEIMNADKKTLRVKQEFKIRGKYSKDNEFQLDPVGVISENDVKVVAVVSCLGGTSCSRAIIDVILKHQNNYYTEQLQSTAFEKPKIVGGKESKKPVVKVEVQEPEIENEVKETADQQATPEVKKAVVSATPEIKKVLIDESKEEADGEHVAEVEEGDDGSIAGRYEGKAALVKLAKIFLSKKEIEDLDKQDTEDKARDNKDKQAVTPEVRKDKRNRLVLTNQAVGSPDAGRLRNASFLKTHLDTYKLTDRIVMANSSTKNYYGTQEMMDVLEALGNKTYSYEQNKIYISRISDRDGGLLPPSKSHQNGMDTDIGYPTVQGKVGFPIVASNGSLKKSDFSTAKTLETFKFLMTQSVSPVDRLFVDQSIINALCREAKNSGKFRGSEKATYVKLFEIMQHVEGHGNHYHMRLRCTPNQPDCQHKIYKKMNNCAG